MINRSLNWLLRRKNQKGGFFRNSRALDSFGGAPEDVTNAYIVWALTESRYIDKVVDETLALYRLTETKRDPYILALTAASLFNIGRIDEARQLCELVVSFQIDGGCVKRAGTTITRSGGISLDIETTSVSILAWLKFGPVFSVQASAAIKWLYSQCQNGKFGSTQGTVLALKAIVAYDAQSGASEQSGAIEITVDGNVVSTTPIANSASVIKLPSYANALTPGRQSVVQVRVVGSGSMPFSTAINYFNTLPETSAECKVELQTRLSSSTFSEGQVGEVQVSLKNTQAEEGLPMTVAIIGLPGGMEPRHDQLKELVEAGKISAFEVTGREVILYWRQMLPGQVVDLKIDVLARIPGVYSANASRAYLYYTEEHKFWNAGVSVNITPSADGDTMYPTL